MHYQLDDMERWASGSLSCGCLELDDLKMRWIKYLYMSLGSLVIQNKLKIYKCLNFMHAYSYVLDISS